MEATSPSLLVRAGVGSADAWKRLDQLYRPFLLQWFCSHGVVGGDAEDLTQEVLLVLSKEVPKFVHSGHRGAFRAWLRGICLNRLLGYRRAQRLRGGAVGGTDFQIQLNDVSDDDATLTQSWDHEHDRAVFRQAYSKVKSEFSQQTLRAFSMLTFECAAASRVAAELGMSIGAVYIAKSRVLRSLRSEAAALVGIDS